VKRTTARLGWSEVASFIFNCEAPSRALLILRHREFLIMDCVGLTSVRKLAGLLPRYLAYLYRIRANSITFKISES
jgi:hypothetical protein